LEQTPPALQQLVQHTGVLHERVILVAMLIEAMSTVNSDELYRI